MEDIKEYSPVSMDRWGFTSFLEGVLVEQEEVATSTDPPKSSVDLHKLQEQIRLYQEHVKHVRGMRQLQARSDASPRRSLGCAFLRELGKNEGFLKHRRRWITEELNRANLPPPPELTAIDLAERQEADRREAEDLFLEEQWRLKRRRQSVTEDLKRLALN